MRHAIHSKCPINWHVAFYSFIASYDQEVPLTLIYSGVYVYWPEMREAATKCKVDFHLAQNTFLR